MESGLMGSSGPVEDKQSGSIANDDLLKKIDEQLNQSRQLFPSSN